MRRLLLLSNSRNPGQGFLNHAESAVRNHLNGIEHVLFVPFAGVMISWDDYTELVRSRFADFEITVDSLHDEVNPTEAIRNAKAIVVGGGNTWHLLRELQRLDVLEIIRKRALSGVPYIGWSAGTNIACPTIRTTNDMPIVEPTSFQALNLIPFQINPHYTEKSIPDHGGEARPQRIEEYLAIHPQEMVLGLREGTWLTIHKNAYTLYGGAAVLFRANADPEELPPGPLTVT